MESVVQPGLGLSCAIGEFQGDRIRVVLRLTWCCVGFCKMSCSLFSVTLDIDVCDTRSEGANIVNQEHIPPTGFASRPSRITLNFSSRILNKFLLIVCVVPGCLSRQARGGGQEDVRRRTPRVHFSWCCCHRHGRAVAGTRAMNEMYTGSPLVEVVTSTAVTTR